MLVLDEPTNDLDLETLELLEAQLVDWPGTLLLVSHDRRFLDNVVTSTLAFEGDGRVSEYVGGYDDWLRQRPAPGGTAAGPGATAVTTRTPGPAAAAPPASSSPAADAGPPARKATNKERMERAALPGRIEKLEEEQRRLSAKVAAPDFYKLPAAEITATMARLDGIPPELLTAYARWDELEGLK